LLRSLIILLLLSGCGKANISNNCIMNGFGAGYCNFTNTGNRSGSICGQIVLTRTRSECKSQLSEVICSGKVEEKSTSKIEFNMIGIGELCKTDDEDQESWKDVCSFEFVSDQYSKDSYRGKLEACILRCISAGECYPNCERSCKEQIDKESK